MPGVHHLRDFILERLSAAAEEIFSEVEKNIIQYEEVIDQQRKLLESNWTPTIQLHRTDAAQQEVPLENEAPFTDQQLFSQISGSVANELERALLQIKEEQEDSPIQEEQLTMKHETNNLSKVDYSVQESNSYTYPIDEQSPLQESEVEDQEPIMSAELNPDFGSLKQINHNFENSLLLESPEGTDSSAKDELVCYTCDRRFRDNSSLQKHMTVHANKKKYACKSCGAHFSRKDVLLRHMRTHPDQFLHPCEICGKCFTRKNILLNHMRIHTGGEQYACKTCGKCFSRRSILWNHLKIHSGEKPFPCEICGKCFIRNSHLLSHMKTHTGERPHSCKICGKGFGRKDCLSRHMRTHTGERPYSCKTCGKCFSHTHGLLYHMTTHW